MRPTSCSFHSGSFVRFQKVSLETSLSRRVAPGGDTPLCLIPYQKERNSGADVGKLYKRVSSPCSAESPLRDSRNGKLLCNSFCENTSSFFCFKSQRGSCLSLVVLILNVLVFQEFFQQTIKLCTKHFNFLPQNHVKVTPSLKESKLNGQNDDFLNIPLLGLES